MENITIGEIIGIISAIMIIAGFVKGILYLIKHNITDRFEKNESQIKMNTEDIKQLKADTDTSKQERELLLKSQLVILKTLKNIEAGTDEDKSNIDSSIDDIEGFIYDHLHK